MSQTDWLAETIEKMDRDIQEMKGDVKSLLLHRAENRGKTIVIAALVSLVVGLIGAWIRAS